MHPNKRIIYQIEMIMVNIEISSSVNNFSFWGKNENENENKYLVWPKMILMRFQDHSIDCNSLVFIENIT